MSLVPRPPFLLLALVACSSSEPHASTDARLVAVENQLGRTFMNRGIKVSLPTPDTLLVHVPIGRNIMRVSRTVVTNLDSASRVVAAKALAVADSTNSAQVSVVVELARSRHFGPFVWSAGTTRNVYGAAELRAAPIPSASPAPLP